MENSEDTAFAARVDARGGATILRFRGAVDLVSAESWDQRLRAACATAPPPGPLVIDLTKVDFLGSVGLRGLAQAIELCDERGVALRVVADTAVVLRPIRLTCLDTIVPVATTVDQALVPAPRPPG